MFTCTLCNKSFQSPGEYDQHKRQEYLNTLFKCSHCGQVFERRDFQLAHERKHIYKIQHECDCGKKFKSREALKNHVMKKHLNEQDDENVCDCGKKFKSRDALKNHVMKKHSNEKDEENDMNDMQEKIKQKAIQLAMEKGIKASSRKYNIGEINLEDWIMDKYVNIDDEKVEKIENFEKLETEAEVNHKQNETEAQVLVLDGNEKSKKQEMDKSEKEREKIAMENRENAKAQGSIALMAVKQIVDKHFETEKENKKDENTEHLTEQEAINQDSEKNNLEVQIDNNKCRICDMIIKEKTHLLQIKEINHYIKMHQICPIYGCGMPVMTSDNWNSHLSDSHKPKKLTKKELNKEIENRFMRSIRQKTSQKKKEFSEPLKQTKRIVDLSTTEEEIHVMVKNNSDGSFEIPKVAARGRSIKPTIMGYSKNNERCPVEPYRSLNRKETSQVKTLNIPHPDNLVNLVASITLSKNGVFNIKIQDPL